MEKLSTQGLWFIAVVQVIIGVISLSVWRRYFTPLSDIPGPFLASISRLWHVKHILAGNHNIELISLHKKHGHFVRIAHNEVSVSHPDGIKKILLAPLEKAAWYKAMAIPDYRFQTPQSETDPKRKVARSKHFASGYTISNLLHNEGHIDEMISLFLGWMDKFAESREPMNLRMFFSFTTSDIIGELLFSQPFGFLSQGKDIGNAIANSIPLSAYAAVMGFFGWTHTLFVANPLVTWLRILPMGHLYDHAVQAIDKRIANKDARFDLISHWFKSLERNPDMTVRDIYAKATSDVGAGLDTVTIGLSSFVYHMIRHPDAWQRARAEIEEAQKIRGLCGDRVISYEDTQKLPFLQACIKEAIRVFAPACCAIAPARGVTIGDRYFPKGTTLSVNPWVMHSSTEFWGPDAAEFNPDRWMKNEDVAVMEKYFIPWGVGYQSCPGQNISKIELSKLAAVLVRDYNIRQVDEAKEWEWKAYITVVPHSWDCYIS
ncbi:Pisatin demethylase [Cytospora mali]|uniref:Pisatin demethylase n=1 Tax=Cytospora mali TaxID=578113 RepID=A0A194UQ23_CYTMA|nr:Pisatin demethylase [Valsa mali var. pyri (nom. inval.)]